MHKCGSLLLGLAFFNPTLIAMTLSDHYACAIKHKECTADHLTALEGAISNTATLASWQ